MAIAVTRRCGGLTAFLNAPNSVSPPNFRSDKKSGTPKKKKKKLLATSGAHVSVVTLPQEAGILRRRLMEAHQDQTRWGCLWFQFHITRHFTLDLIGGTVGSWCRSSVRRSLMRRADHAQDVFVIIWMQKITSV